MKRAVAWIAGLVGIAALGRALARRRRPAAAVAEQPGPPPVGDDPAEELRRKLAEQRPPEPDAAAAPVDETLEERRARVHAKAREAIDAMDDGPAA